MWLTFLTHFAASQGDCDADKAQKLLGIIPKWYEYLNYQPDALGRCAVHFDTSNIASSGISGGTLNPLLGIGLAIFDMLLRIGGLVAVGFVIYGGFKYLTSQGEPENTRAALSTIINAIVGLVITVVAAAAVSYFAGRFG